MEKRKKSILSGTLVAGVLLTAGSLSVSANDGLQFSDLGSGSEIRSNLLETQQNKIAVMVESTFFADVKGLEAKCGEGKCGEGKCGEDKKDKKVKKAKKGGADDKKSEKKSDEAEKKKSEDKTKEAKCGEGKCGE